MGEMPMLAFMAENYQKLEQALGAKLNYEPYYEQAKAKSWMN